MIKKFYECTCDYCGRVINHYPDIRPTKEDFKEIGAVVYGRKIFCDNRCLANYRHDLTEIRVGNLKQFQPGKRFERK